MAKENNRFQIGEIAKETGASIDTIRYYEKLGLLAKPARSEGGFRIYSKAMVDRLRFVKKAKSLGLTLKEIRGIVQCSDEGLRPCCDLVRKLFEKKITEFETRIKELQKMRRNLVSLLSQWVSSKEARNRPFAVCPQIETKPKKRGREKMRSL